MLLCIFIFLSFLKKQIQNRSNIIFLFYTNLGVDLEREILNCHKSKTGYEN